MGVDESRQLEIHRARWRREREAYRMNDPDAEGFATGWLPVPHMEPLVRLLVLLGEPEADIIAFDGPFWEWFTGDLPDPGSGGRADWGSSSRPTSRAAIRYQPCGEDACHRYLAVHRSGALEMGLGRDAGRVAEQVDDLSGGRPRADRGGRGFLCLTTTVGRVWAAAAAYADVVARRPVVGPFQVILAVRQTRGMVLCNFGTGWAEPNDAFTSDPVACSELGLLRLLELPAWPDQDGIQALAFDEGAWLEDSFVSRHQRYVARTGPFQGRFDGGQYRW